jgi:signal transduction histidine kinase
MKYKFSKGSFQIYLLVFTLNFVVSSNINGQTVKNLKTKIEELKSTPDFNPENPAYIDLLFELAKEQIHINIDSTLQLANEGLALSLKSDYKKGQGYAYLRLGDYYSQMSNKEEYKKAYDKALEFSTKYNYDQLKIIILNNYGTTLSIDGDVDNALKYYLEGIDLSKKNNDNKMLSILNDNIAVMYSGLKDFETALSFHESSLRYNTENQNEVLLARTLSNMAFANAYLHNFQEANKALDKAMLIFTKEGEMDWLSYCYEVKGIIALEIKDYTNALEWYMESNLLCEDLDYFTGSLNTYNGLAEAYVGLGQIDSAEHYALKANIESKTHNYPEALMKSSKTLSTIYKLKGKYKTALDYQDIYLKLDEEAGLENFKKGLAMLRSNQKFEAQKEQILVEKNREIASQQALTYIALGGLIVLIVMFILIYRNFKIQGRFNGILQNKQQVLLQRELELKESNTTKDKLFSLIAHDLRGPIHSFLELMQLYAIGNMSKEESDKFLPVALQDLSSIAEMLDNLLVWGKTQISGTSHEPKNINIHKLVRKNVRLLKPLAIKKSIYIINEIGEDIVSFSDAAHIDIVVRNLLSNSIKFTNTNGKITISGKEKDGQLQLSISDNGVGMSLEVQKRLFKKNNHETTYGTNNEKGTGLGLYLCQEMVEKNGGKIWVESVLNKGTTFYFTIPSKLIIKKAV